LLSSSVYISHSRDRTQFPTRLIAVAPIHGRNQARLHLVTEEDSEEDIKYLTLSHFLGGANIYKLTKERPDSMLDEIGESLFPKTFQDALEITRRLEYRFIWIDSLCIFQNLNNAED
jgi:hypothetical protein